MSKIRLAGVLFLVACGATPANVDPEFLVVAVHDGDNQTAIGNTKVATAPAVKVIAADGTPRAGVFVRFEVVDGGGLLGVTTYPLDPAKDYLTHTTTTDADGIARLSSWKLGPPNIAQRVTAFVSVTSNQAVDFEATAVTGPFRHLTGFNRSFADGFGVVGEPLAVPPQIRAVDEGWNSVAGVPVRWRVISGGGTITGVQTVTGPDGTAGIGSWILGPTAGPQALGVIADLPNQMELPLGATAAPGPVATIEKLASDFQVAMAGSATPQAPRVRVLDRYGNPAFPRQVIFSVLTGGGSVDNTHRIAESDGIAGVMEWRLGPTPGENRLRVTAEGVSTEFVATGTP
jgi:hypothetical protein